MWNWSYLQQQQQQHMHACTVRKERVAQHRRAWPDQTTPKEPGCAQNTTCICSVCERRSRWFLVMPQTHTADAGCVLCAARTASNALGVVLPVNGGSYLLVRAMGVCGVSRRYSLPSVLCCRAMAGVPMVCFPIWHWYMLRGDWL